MSILFKDIYSKAIALFDDPKITVAYKTNEIQFCKLMYTYMQNAIALFTNPASIGVRLSEYTVPEGKMETYNGDGSTVTFPIDHSFDLFKENCLYSFIADGQYVEGEIDKNNYTVTFKCSPLAAEKQYAFEQYFPGEFTGNFSGYNSKTQAGDNLINGEIKDILARLLVKAWAEEERNLVLDIRNILQDSDFKLTGNDRVLKAKDQWIDQLDTEVLQLQNRLSWQIRFMYSAQQIGRG